MKNDKVLVLAAHGKRFKGYLSGKEEGSTGRLQDHKKGFSFFTDVSGYHFSPIAISRCMKLTLVCLLYFLISVEDGQSQSLSLKEAVQTALANYGSIKARANYVKAAEASLQEARVDHLPNLTAGIQQSYGTINGQFGPLLSGTGLNSASSGPPFTTQNWHAAFGSLYLASLNWEFFTFGRIDQKIKLAGAELIRDKQDLDQAKFQHKVRVAGAYLNLLAAQRLKLAQQKNLDRANSLRAVVVTRAINGLNAGVDSSLANAEVSNAKIALTNAITFEAEQASQLAQLMGVPFTAFMLDTMFVSKVPAFLIEALAIKDDAHPLLRSFESRINVSRQQEKYLNRFKYPVFSLIGAAQSRGSGFDHNYSETYPEAFTHNYWSGIKPIRSNYLVGVALTWNFTNIRRVRQQVVSRQWISRGLQDEYEVLRQQIKAQAALADLKMKNALANYTEAPVQMKAASDAYNQKSVLYKNGLTTIVEVTQALYTLNRAETERDIAYNNVWQALLLQAAASGQFDLFEKEIQ